MAVIGIDIGGTKTLVASFHCETEVPTNITRVETPQDPNQAISIISEMVVGATQSETCQAIGISAGGPLNAHDGSVSSLNLPLWNEVPIVKLLSESFNCPVKIEVDTDAAVLAEKFIAHPTFDNIFYITVSTGIGGGYYTNHGILRGAGFAHPEIGHQQINHEKLQIKCACGSINCLEALISGTALRKRFHVERAQDLNEQQWMEFAIILGQALRNVSHFYAPEHISIGGAVALFAPDWVHQTIREYLKKHVYIVPCPSYELSSLGYEACLRGAALIGFQSLAAVITDPETV